MSSFLILDTKAAIVNKMRGNMERSHEKDEKVMRFWEKTEVKMIFPDDDKEKRDLLVSILTLPNFSKHFVDEIKKLMGNEAKEYKIDIWCIEPKRFFSTLKQRCFREHTRKAPISKMKSSNCEVTLAKVSNEKIAMAITYYK